MVFLNPRNSCSICRPLVFRRIYLKLIGWMHGLIALLSSKRLRKRMFTSTSSLISTSFLNKKTSPRNLKLTNASISGSVVITLTHASSLLSNSIKAKVLKFKLKSSHSHFSTSGSSQLPLSRPLSQPQRPITRFDPYPRKSSSSTTPFPRAPPQMPPLANASFAVERA